jgi:CHASE3 domain sensor protein
MKDKFEQRAVGFFVLMAAFFVCITLFAVKTPQEAAKSSAWVNKTHDFIIEVNAVLSSLHAGESSFFTWLQNSDSRDQNAYRHAYTEMLEHLEKAKAMTRSGAEKELQGSQILELENLIGKHVDFIRPAAKTRKQTSPAVLPDAASMDTIEQLVKNITDQENNLLMQRDQDSHLKARAVRRMLYAGAGVNFVLLLFAAWLLRDDLAVRRRATHDLQEINAALEAKVQALTDELLKSNQALKQENLERRWSNQALEHQLRYNQLIINSIDELVFVISKALNISRINPAVSHHTHWEPQDLVAQSLDRVLQLNATPNPIADALREGREIKDRDALLLTKSGPAAPVRYSMVPLHDQDKVVGAVVTVRIQSQAQKS